MRRVFALAGVVTTLLLVPAAAHADRAFSSRFAANTQGDITIAANSLESCLDALAACANVRNGTGSGLNNNDRTVTWVDADGDPATFDSSAADLTLPAGATVLFAGLYYGGRLNAGQGGSPPPSPAARNTVLFKAPGDTGYRSLTASQVDDSSTQYQGFVNVTSIVAAAGAGSYWTANVQLGTGLSDSGSGGWALVVAYGDPAAPSRNLSVFDGMQSVGGSSHGNDPFERLPDAADRAGELDGRAGRLRGGSGDDRRRGGDPGWVGCLHRAVECRQPRAPGHLGLEFERLQLDDLERRRAGHLAHAELPQQPRLRRGSVPDHGRARQRPDEHAGQAVDERRRLPAGCGDARHRPVRAEDHRDEDRQCRHGESRGHADLHGCGAEHRVRTGRRPRRSADVLPGGDRLRPRQHPRQRSRGERHGR